MVCLYGKQATHQGNTGEGLHHGTEKQPFGSLGRSSRKKKHYTRLGQPEWAGQKAATGWLNGLNFPIKLARQVFTNKDGSSGIFYLACSKLAAGWDEITTTYQKRWKVEAFHKSLKSNAAFAKSPAHTAKTQANPLFASLVAVFKRACLTPNKKLNHFSLRSKLYLKAIRMAFDELQTLRAA